MAGVSGGKPFRQQRVDIGADELVAGEAEQIDGPRVRVEDAAGGVDREDGVRRRLQDGRGVASGDLDRVRQRGRLGLWQRKSLLRAVVFSRPGILGIGEPPWRSRTGPRQRRVHDT
jgi:hypothetical protein